MQIYTYLPPNRMNSIEYSNTNRRLGALAAELADGAIQVPPHQRDYVWTPKQQKKLVDAVIAGMPMPNITLRTKRVGNMTVTTLEDGQQRLTTLSRFMTNAFRDGLGRTFSQLSDVDRARFESYMVNVLTYSNATDEQAIVIFNNLQNGSSCSVGERIFSLAKISPIVQFAIEMLLTPGMGFYDRTLPFWGERTAKGQRGAHTSSALALCAGLAFGSNYVSKNWTIIEDIISKSFDKHRVIADIETIVSLYEEVHQAYPVTSKSGKKTLWDLGTFTGYIIHGMMLTPEMLPGLPSREAMLARFKALMIEHRTRPEVLDETLHCDMSDARNWLYRRWHTGWQHLFTPDAVSPTEGDQDEDTWSDA